MIKPQHTPGIWSRNIKPISRYPTIFAGRNTHIARVVTDGISHEEAEANACLITAAPDLLAILTEIMTPSPHYSATQDWRDQLASVRERAATAIAKANGAA